MCLDHANLFVNSWISSSTIIVVLLITSTPAVIRPAFVTLQMRRNNKHLCVTMNLCLFSNLLIGLFILIIISSRTFSITQLN
jgi:hypothetical protein